MRICDILPKQTVETTEIRDAIFNIIIPSIGIEASNDTLYFKKNFVDIEKEAYQIPYILKTSFLRLRRVMPNLN